MTICQSPCAGFLNTWTCALCACAVCCYGQQNSTINHLTQLAAAAVLHIEHFLNTDQASATLIVHFLDNIEFVMPYWYAKLFSYVGLKC